MITGGRPDDQGHTEFHGTRKLEAPFAVSDVTRVNTTLGVNPFFDIFHYSSWLGIEKHLHLCFFSQ